MTHGTESGYNSGCRCRECKRGHREYVTAWRQRPAQVRKRQIKALAKVSEDAARIAALDAEVERIKANLTPCKPMGWEVEKAIREERDALRLKVADLEAQIDRMVDASLAAEVRSFPSGVGGKPGRSGRPQGAKDRKPRVRRAR